VTLGRYPKMDIYIIEWAETYQDLEHTLHELVVIQVDYVGVDSSVD